MNHEAPHYDEHPERSQNEWQTLMSNGVVDTDFRPTKEYLASEQGQKEAEALNKAHDQIKMVDGLIANAKEQAENGRYSNVEFERLKKKLEVKKEAYQAEANKQSEAAMQEFSDTFVDRNSVGVPESEWVEDPKVYSREEVLAQKADEAQPDVEEATKTTPEIEIKIELEDQLKSDMEEARRLEDLQKLVEAEQEAEALGNLQAAVEAQQDPEDISSQESLEALEKQLNEQRTNLAELFVKKSRIFGPKHREEYTKAREDYEALRDRYLRLKSETSQENNALLENYLQEDSKLLAEVEDRVDNGNFYRKLISRTLGNKYYKQAMLAYGVKSLGVIGAEDANLSQPTEASVANNVPETAPSRSSTFEDIIPPEEEAVSSVAGPTPEELDARRNFQDELSRTEVGILVGPAGIELMSVSNPENGTDRPEVTYRIAEWWNHLPEVAKNAVRTYEATQADSPYGGHLRLWLDTLDRAAAEQNSQSNNPSQPTPESTT